MSYIVRILSIFLVFFYFQFFPQQLAQAPPRLPQPFYEVIGVPIGLTQEQMHRQLRTYIERKDPVTKNKSIIVGVPQTPALPAYVPLPFYQPDFLAYIADTNGGIQFFDPSCSCNDNPEMKRIKDTITQQRTQLEQLLIVRSALYNYYIHNKKLPKKLEELAGAFPANYLSRIPFTQAAHNEAIPALHETGILYQPERLSPKKLWESMSDVLYSRDTAEPPMKLQPLEIVVYQSSFRMVVQSGAYAVRSYPIGLGAEHRTPLGSYTIKQKVSNPVSENNVYGTRGLVLNDTAYAIHGTNNPNSIGKAVSMGCIRLFNSHVEELFSMAPIGTKVNIKAGAAPGLQQPNAPAFTVKPRINEENPHHVYHWKQ